MVGGGSAAGVAGGAPHKLLQQPDVEHIVQPGTRWKLEEVGDVVDDGCDAVWPIEARPKLPLGDHVQGR